MIIALGIAAYILIGLILALFVFNERDGEEAIALTFLWPLLIALTFLIGPFVILAKLYEKLYRFVRKEPEIEQRNSTGRRALPRGRDST